MRKPKAPEANRARILAAVEIYDALTTSRPYQEKMPAEHAIARMRDLIGTSIEQRIYEALEQSGAGTRDLGIEVDRRITIDRHGRVIGERRLPQILTSWDRLQRLLRATIDEAHYHLGHTFESVEQDSREVRVYFAEGKVERADLLIGGDGICSGVRAQVETLVQPSRKGRQRMVSIFHS